MSADTTFAMEKIRFEELLSSTLKWLCVATYSGLQCREEEDGTPIGSGAADVTEADAAALYFATDADRIITVTSDVLGRAVASSYPETALAAGSAKGMATMRQHVTVSSTGALVSVGAVEREVGDRGHFVVLPAPPLLARCVAPAIIASVALTSLEFRASGLTDHIVEDLVYALASPQHVSATGSEQYPNLRLIDVSGNPLITRRGGVALLRLVCQRARRFPRLDILDVQGTSMPAQQRQRIAAELLL